MKWRTDVSVQNDHTIHVWPDEETREHVLHGTDCECIPKIELVPEKGVRIVTHHSYRTKRRNLTVQ